MRRALSIDGSLHLNDGNSDISITAAGTRLVAEIGNFATDPRFMQRMGVDMRLARRVSDELNARDLTLVITRDGAPLAELGAGVHGGFLGRLFGFSHLRFAKRH